MTADHPHDNGGRIPGVQRIKIMASTAWRGEHYYMDQTGTIWHLHRNPGTPDHKTEDNE